VLLSKHEPKGVRPLDPLFVIAARILPHLTIVLLDILRLVPHQVRNPKVEGEARNVGGTVRSKVLLELPNPLGVRDDDVRVDKNADVLFAVSAFFIYSVFKE
jgi:hypothetical protein